MEGGRTNNNNKEIFIKIKENFEFFKRIVKFLEENGIQKELQVELEGGQYTKRVNTLEELEKKLYYAFKEEKPFAIHWSTAIYKENEKINEIVIDLDEETLEKNQELLKKILFKLKELKISDYYVKTSGNKGYHLVISPLISNDKKQQLLDFLKQLSEAGYKIDMNKISSNRNMIRAPLSINFKSNKFSEVIKVVIKRKNIDLVNINIKEQLLILIDYYKKLIDKFNSQKQEQGLDEDLQVLILKEDIERTIQYINKTIANEVLGQPYGKVETLLKKISNDLSKEITLDNELGLNSKILVNIIKEEVEETNNIVTGITYYLMLFIDNILTVKKVTTKLKEKKDEVTIKSKIKEELLMIDQVESFGLYTEEGERRLFVKYKNGIVQEVRLDSKPEIKELLIKWLKDNNLLIDLVFKYGYIWSGKDVKLNVFEDYTLIRVSEYNKDNIIKEQVGSYNPNKKASHLFLPISFAKTCDNSCYNFEFFEHILEGLYKSTIVKIVVGYSFAVLLKDIIKENSILPVLPNLWLYSSIPNTGKTTVLHIVRVINMLKEFESGVTIAQVRNLLSIRNNVVVIDDIQNFGDNETKKIITSWLKASSTQSITITLGTGEQFVISSPIATTSNYHPKDVLNGDEALLQRIILVNVNKTIISSKWLKRLYTVLPNFNSKVNNQLALGVYITHKLKELTKKIDLTLELFVIKEKIQKIIRDLIEKDDTIRNKYQNGYKYLDDRFMSFVTFIYYGLWLFSKIYYNFLEKLDEVKLVKELAEFIIENNEVYRGESILSIIVPLLIEIHNINIMDSENPLIKDIQILKEMAKRNISMPILFKIGEYFIFLKTKEFVDYFTREAKVIFGNNYSFFKIMSELRNAGFDPSYKLHINRREFYFDNGLLKMRKTDEKIQVRVLRVPSQLIEPFLKQTRSYILIDLENNEYTIVGEESNEKEKKEEEVMLYEN